MSHFLYKIPKKNGGFTLIELLVAASLFVVVVMSIGGSLVGIISTYRRTIAIRANVDNLGSAMESMVRGIKTGTNFYSGYSSDIASTNDTPSTPDSTLSYTSSDGKRVVVCLGQSCPGSCSACVASPNQVFRSSDGGSTFLPLTAPPPYVTMNSLQFVVKGSSPGDGLQPRVFVLSKGTTGAGNSQTSFILQTTITQRMSDI